MIDAHQCPKHSYILIPGVEDQYDKSQRQDTGVFTLCYVYVHGPCFHCDLIGN